MIVNCCCIWPARWPVTNLFSCLLRPKRIRVSAGISSVSAADLDTNARLPFSFFGRMLESFASQKCQSFRDLGWAGVMGNTDEMLPMPEPLAEVLVNYLSSWRPNEQPAVVLESPRQSLQQREQSRRASALANSGRAFHSSLWDARVPALARELARFKRRIAEGHAGSIAARGCEHYDADLRSRPRLGTARGSGEVARILRPDVATSEKKLVRVN